MRSTKQEGLSYDAKTIIVILLLLVIYPVGLILMLVWMKWPIWVKLLVSLPLSILIIIFLVAIISTAGSDRIQNSLKEMGDVRNRCEELCKFSREDDCEKVCFDSNKEKMGLKITISPTLK